jgi:pantothenate kinase
MSYVAVVGGAIAVGGALLQGRTNRQNAGAQAMENDYEGQQGIEAAQQQAAIIQRAGQYAVSRATASYAASGVVVGEGSAQETSNKITTDSTHDAYMGILSAQKKANQLRAQGSIGVSNASAASNQAVLAAGAKAVSGWATAAQG